MRSSSKHSLGATLTDGRTDGQSIGRRASSIPPRFTSESRTAIKAVRQRIIQQAGGEREGIGGADAFPEPPWSPGQQEGQMDRQTQANRQARSRQLAMNIGHSSSKARRCLSAVGIMEVPIFCGCLLRKVRVWRGRRPTQLDSDGEIPEGVEVRDREEL